MICVCILRYPVILNTCFIASKFESNIFRSKINQYLFSIKYKIDEKEIKIKIIPDIMLRYL